MQLWAESATAFADTPSLGCGSLRRLFRRGCHYSVFLAALTERLFYRPARRFVLSAGLPVLALQEHDWLPVDKDYTAGLDAFDYHLLEKRTLLESVACYRRMHLPDAAIRVARPSQRLEATQHLLKQSSQPSSRLQRLQPRLTPAQTVPACLWCPTSSAYARV